MKFIYAALVSYGVNADLNGLKEAVAQIRESHPQSKSFGSTWAADIIDSINSYGCWCYFQDNHGAGRGPAQNEVDNQCKILHEGYECIMMDAVDEGDDSCLPWHEEYKSATGLGLLVDHDDNDTLEEALRFRCKKANKKSKTKCAERSCIVENYFVVRVMRLFLKGVPFDPSLKHDKNIFDPKANCPTVQGIQSDKECCGLYPFRFPFKTLSGSRDCCGQRTFNSDLMMCCDDMNVRLSC